MMNFAHNVLVTLVPENFCTSMHNVVLHEADMLAIVFKRGFVIQHLTVGVDRDGQTRNLRNCKLSDNFATEVLFLPLSLLAACPPWQAGL